MWERCAENGRGGGDQVELETRVDADPCTATGATAVAVRHRADGAEQAYRPRRVISSMPLSAAGAVDGPAGPAEVVAAADDLRYRDFLTVALVVPEATASRTTGSTSTTRA